MGCWNGTCAISNLPITYNEPVKLIFLQGECNYSGLSAFYEPTNYLAPAFYPIDALYDDYGSVENIKENWNTKLITEYLIKRFGNEVPHHHNSKNDTKTIPTTIEAVTNLIERGLCNGDTLNQKKDKELLRPAPDQSNWEEYGKWLSEYIVSMEKSNQPLSFTLVRKDVWDIAIKIASELKEGYYLHFEEVKWNNSLTLKEVLTKEFHYKIKQIEEFSQIFTIDDNEEIKEKSLSSKRFLNQQTSPFNFQKENRENFINYDDYHQLYIESNDEELKTLIFNEWLEFELISAFMSRARKAWNIHPGAGSQNASWKLNADFYQKVSDIANDLYKQYQEENEDEDEEEI